MNHRESGNARDQAGAAMVRGAVLQEGAFAHGVYTAVLVGPREDRRGHFLDMTLEQRTILLQDFHGLRLRRALAINRGDRAEVSRCDGLLELHTMEVKWADQARNVVTTQGKNHALDCFLRAQAQITTWYLGLISSVSYSAVAAGDTAGQINGTNGWKEAGPTNAPNYTGNRQGLTVGNPASGGSLASSATSNFPFTAGGTVKGLFLVSTNTKDGTTGTLYSAGLFSGGDKVAQNGDTLQASYTASL